MKRLNLIDRDELLARFRGERLFESDDGEPENLYANFSPESMVKSLPCLTIVVSQNFKRYLVWNDRTFENQETP